MENILMENAPNNELDLDFFFRLLEIHIDTNNKWKQKLDYKLRKWKTTKGDQRREIARETDGDRDRELMKRGKGFISAIVYKMHYTKQVRLLMSRCGSSAPNEWEIKLLESQRLYYREFIYFFVKEIHANGVKLRETKRYTSRSESKSDLPIQWKLELLCASKFQFDEWNMPTCRILLELERLSFLSFTFFFVSKE